MKTLEQILQEYPNADMCIAVVGIGLRLPGANSPTEFWRNLIEGRNGIREFSREQITRLLGREPSPEQIPFFGQISDVDRFDYDFFNFLPSEALMVDPQHRVFLECCWQALEDAGVVPEGIRSRIGVFAGQSESEYLQLLYKHGIKQEQFASDWQMRLATGIDFLATRVSYALDLTGPAMTVQTGCSTSMIAVIQAAQSLILGDCDVALAGGSSVHFIPRFGEYAEGGILDPRGTCRAFDVDSKGTVASNGVAVVVLKRLEDALRQRDNIQSVIIGYQSNNDGRAKIGFTAPSIEGQSRAIKGALINGDIDPESIAFIECHGTGTQLGDPIEIAALKKVFGANQNKISIGSVKSNIGHTDAAAGVAGLIKMALSIKNGAKPPSIHFSKPNPALTLEDSPLVIQSIHEKWEWPHRRGAVSSFGIGGTNAHVVLEESPVSTPNLNAKNVIITVSGHTPEVALAHAKNIKEFISKQTKANLGNIAFTLQTGRKEQLFRHAFVVDENEPIAEKCDVKKAKLLSTVWLFPGHGAQYWGMTKEMYQQDSAYRSSCDEVMRLFRLHDIDLAPALRGEKEHQGLNDQHSMVQAQAFNFCVQYAIGARLQKILKRPPTAMAAHSLGMFAAATLAGVFSLTDAVAIVAQRSRLFDQAPKGKMIAVKGLYDPNLIKAYEVSLAALNQKDQFVLSGSELEIEKLTRDLEASGYEVKPLRISSAAHSHLMNDSYEPYLKFLKGLQFSPPNLALYSDLTGELLTPEQATSPEHWASHLNSTVMFAKVIENLGSSSTDTLFIEVGPGRTLTGLLNASHASPSSLTVPHALDEKCSHFFFKECIARIWELGGAIHWNQIEETNSIAHKVSVPTLPFERHKLSFKNFDLELNNVSLSAPSFQVSQAQSSEPALAPLPAEALQPNQEQLVLTIIGLFTRATGKPDVTPESNFFALGGDSLMAMQMLKALRQDLGMSIPARALFKNPTPLSLAQFLQGEKK